jgi:hypothetical protein
MHDPATLVEIRKKEGEGAGEREEIQSADPSAARTPVEKHGRWRRKRRV